MQTQINYTAKLNDFKENKAFIENASNYLQKTFLIGNDLRKLIDYAEEMADRNLKIFEDSNYNSIDFVTETLLMGYDGLDKAKKTIRTRIINHKRTLIAKAQAEGDTRFDKESKFCNKCKKEREIENFAIRTDKRTGFKYYNSYCKECERKRRNSSFQNSEQQHKSNRERQKRWRENDKKKKQTNLQ